MVVLQDNLWRSGFLTNCEFIDGNCCLLSHCLWIGFDLILAWVVGRSVGFKKKKKLSFAFVLCVLLETVSLTSFVGSRKCPPVIDNGHCRRNHICKLL